MIDDHTALAGLAAAASRLTGPLSTADLTRPVPTCPGWDLERLISHTGRVHRWVQGVVLDEPESAPGRPPSGEAIVGWFDEGAAALVAALGTVDLDAETDTFLGRGPRRFWLRRMLHETTVHAWDALAALGEPQPIDVAIALDGIDEVLEVMVPSRFDLAGFGPSDETLHLHATDDGLADGEGEWMLAIGSDGVAVTRTHGKGDVAVRGSTSDLDLLLWGRPTDGGALTVFGDASILDRFSAAAAF